MEGAASMAHDPAHADAEGATAAIAVANRPLDPVIDELIAAWNAHDLERVLACYDPAFAGTDVGEAATQQGITGIRKMIRRWFRAFPDLQLTPETVIIEGDRVALGWLLRATHQGTFMRIPPTRRPVTVRGVTLMTIVNGRITEGSRLWDMAAFLRNVGLLPELRDSAEE
jgi:steroid delta-isomerase-like uncharacterized protein